MNEYNNVVENFNVNNYMMDGAKPEMIIVDTFQGNTVPITGPTEDILVLQCEDTILIVITTDIKRRHTHFPEVTTITTEDNIIVFRKIMANTQKMN